MSRPPPRPGPSSPDLLLDLDDSRPIYTSGARAPANDDELLQRFNIDDSEDPQPRPSVTYDRFVGGSSTGQPRTTTAVAGPSSGRPYLAAADGRAYSQTSELHNYQRYYDGVDDDDRSGGYDAGGDEHDLSGGAVRQVRPGGLFGIGGGIVGRARNALGGGPGYSEMDLPLTETAQPMPRSDTSSSDIKRRDSKPGGFKFGFRRGKPDPSTLGPRIIHLNNPPANAPNRFPNNHISTAKYNAATFLPKFLFEQFSKYANVFFLFTAVLQQIPNISPTNKYTTIVPLILVLLVSAIKELVEDFRRRASDSTLNNSPTQVLRGSTFQKTRWINVGVGDIVRVESEESLPADVILLASSEPEGLCYIETANLDGETNLKIKQALPETAHLISEAAMSRLGGRIKSEQPNSSLYTYEGTLTTPAGGGERELSLSPEQLLLRGATLRNTPWVHGVVVFTGHETKLMRNATATPIKKTAVEKMINKQILLLGAILISLSLVSSVGDLIVRARSASTMWYLDIGVLNPVKQFFSDILTYWVLYSNLVPISLFVTVEIVKYAQAFLIGSDLDMYYDQTDTPATCRTSSLVEELGQVEYIFSDKTGTLTRNQMEFRQCSIGGLQYSDEVPEDRRATVEDGEELGIHDFKQLEENRKGHRTRSEIHEFLTLLAVCHTVIPETSEKEIKYQAASPDEGALVEGAALLGYKFVARKPRSVVVQYDGNDEEYELLAVCEFNSTRKRMSTVFRCPDGKIRLYCKGADTVIMERLGRENPHTERTLRHLEDYASEGLRTLCLAVREVPDDEFTDWHRVFNKAATTVGGNRADELDKAAEIIEHDLTLLGATAIEDKLQDGVPETIHTLQTAGIKIWVLTGDRQETAINIGMSSRLISEDMVLLLVNEDGREATRENLERKLAAVRAQRAAGAGAAEMDSMALVIDGKSLAFALERDTERMLLELAVTCKAVICCRVSPLQKALVVKLVKRHMSAILLAIGDGANDVTMIQAAHVGVGISGMEGLQAARSADVAIGQFRYLRKLLLVHGAWSYHRVAKVILYSFYKNVTLFMTQFWYSFNNAFSGQSIYESWTLSFFNVLFTVAPPFIIGVFDQFVSARMLDRYPQLYRLSQRGVFFRMRTFISWVLNGFVHSLVLYVASVFIFARDRPESDGKVAGHWVWGTALYTAALTTVLLKASLVVNIWTWWTFLAIPCSLLLWLVFLAAYAAIAPALHFSTEFHGINSRIWGDLVFYMMPLVLAPLCMLRDFSWK
jgi:phospholipid-transporting ATPase